MKHGLEGSPGKKSRRHKDGPRTGGLGIVRARHHLGPSPSVSHPVSSSGRSTSSPSSSVSPKFVKSQVTPVSVNGSSGVNSRDLKLP